MPAHAPDFLVLLGADYAGKSTAMARLRHTAPADTADTADTAGAGTGPRRRTLSTDEDFLAPQHQLLNRLRRDVVKDVAANEQAYSPDFLATLLQSAAVHLRDEILRDPAAPAVVDSYYYKLLAKCRLAGARDNSLFAWWRSFPQPRRVIYLQVSPSSAWRRAGHGRALNRLEYYGPRPTLDGFTRYQDDLAKTMHDEIAHLPVTVVDEHPDPRATAQAIQKVIDHELG
ncbi:hypothetical protein [Streptomyces purpureus]|uniref:Thymidylate kinase n=1 Tax=Streptomyces purpureus TaxID=1951 RepID=A0A918HHJ4_9ACTN|nr:hypothetical protein [Streptomyces purpureus]GGT64789.1 hypothetical protein GCM10014713_67300 [Streptomyces purpureus]